MQPPKPPKVTAVEIIPAQPTEADSAAIGYLSAEANRPLPQVVHVVKVRLQSKPPATSMGWALYVGDVLIPKYWEYADGIYFTVLDPQFLAEHKGQRLRFSHDGVDFVDTGMKLPAPTVAAAKVKRKAAKVKGKAAKSKGKAAKGKRKAAKGKEAKLPLQSEVLK
jgi:hypothetical protein